MKFLKQHPFSVKAYFDHSTVLTFAVPKEDLESLIPDCLELDTYDDKWAFVAIAIVQTKALRPSRIPEFLGNNFFLIGYRIFVRYQNLKGQKLRGLYVLKSETDKLKMQFLGNIFTHFNYATTDINTKTNETSTIISSKKSDFKIEYLNQVKETQLPIQSPFRTWREARKFAGPMQYTFSYSKKSNKVIIVKAIRKNWKPQPLSITNYHINFLKELGFKEKTVLANAFQIKNVPYQWQKGEVELWN
ncbi:DUF2071 domain-containing protein [Wenyingzhuangia sp. IMCC45574]